MKAGIDMREATAAIGESYTVTPTREMMQDYRVGATTAPAGMLATAVVGDGGMIVFNLTSDGRLLRLSRDPDSLTGWTQAALDPPAPTPAPSGIWCYADADGAPHLVVGMPGHGAVEDMSLEGLCDATLDATGSPGAYRASGFSPLYQIGTISPVGPSFFGGMFRARIAPPGAPGLLGGFSGATLGMICTENQPDNLIDCPAKLVALPALATPATFPGLIAGPSSLTYFHGTGWYTEGIWPELICTQTALPQLNTTDFAVVATASNSAQVVAVDGSNRISVLLGVAQPDGSVSWGASWSTFIPAGAGNLGFTEVKAWQRVGGELEIVVKDSAGRLWKVAQPAVLQWAAIPLTGPGVGDWLLIEEHGQDGFLFVDAAGKLNLRIHDGTGMYRAEVIEIDGDADVVETTTYRAGVTIATADGIGVSGLPVTVAASDEIEISINGAAHLIGPGDTAAVTTDATGSLWITTTIGDALYAPVFTFTSSVFAGGQLEIRPDTDVRDELANVTPQALLQSGILDPAHANEQDAEQVAKALKKALATTEAAYRPIADGPTGRVNVAVQRGVRWRMLQSGAAPDLLRPDDLPSVPWRFSVRSGRPVFEILSAAEAEAYVAERRAVGCGHVRDRVFFNPFSADDWEDAVDSVTDGLSSVAEVVVDGLSAVVTFVVDGIEFVVDTVIDTVAKAFDLVTAILDAVGTVLGTVVGWLLEAVGFLFGWDDIKRQRDAFKAWATKFILNAPTVLPEPKAGVDRFILFLEEAEAHVAEWVREARSSPRSSSPLGTIMAGAPPLPDLFKNVDGMLALPGSTWLTEKLQSALAAFSSGLPAPDIEGLDDAFAAFQTALTQAAASFDFGDQVESLIGGWIADPAAFAKGNFDPVLDLADAVAPAALGAMATVARAGGDLLELCWKNPQAVIDWLDAKLSVPFFSAFYKSVLKGNFSALDVSCLAMGIIAVATGKEIAPPAGDTADEDSQTVQAVLAILGYGCLTTALASGASAASSDAPVTRILVFIDAAVAAMAVSGQAYIGGVKPVVTTQAALAVLTALFTVKSANSFVLTAAALIQCIINVVQLLRNSQDSNAIAYSYFEAFQVGAYSLAAGRTLSGPQAVAFGAFQAGMSALMTHFWYEGLDASGRTAPAVA